MDDDLLNFVTRVSRSFDSPPPSPLPEYVPRDDQVKKTRPAPTKMEKDNGETTHFLQQNLSPSPGKRGNASISKSRGTNIKKSSSTSTTRAAVRKEQEDKIKEQNRAMKQRLRGVKKEGASAQASRPAS